MTICTSGLVIFMILHIFSPWTLTIKIRRSALDPPAAVISTQDGSNRTTLSIPGLKNDRINRSFGNLEEEFLRSIKRPSTPPKRSRDDSIKLIYDIKSPSDWLDLIEGHDEHVCCLLL